MDLDREHDANPKSINCTQTTSNIKKKKNKKTKKKKQTNKQKTLHKLPCPIIKS